MSGRPTQAAYKLKNLAILQPQLQPEIPAQEILDAEGIVIDLEKKIRRGDPETYFGTGEQTPDTGDAR